MKGNNGDGIGNLNTILARETSQFDMLGLWFIGRWNGMKGNGLFFNGNDELHESRGIGIVILWFQSSNWSFSRSKHETHRKL